MSAEEESIVHLAIEVCSSDDYKNALQMDDISSDKPSDDRKRDFEQNLENVTVMLLNRYEMQDQLLERVIGRVFAMTMRILSWAVFIEGTFGIPRAFCFSLLNPNIFTDEGTIDEEKAAIKLVRRSKGKQLRFQLSSHYCFKDQISKLIKHFKAELKSSELKNNLSNIKQSSLVVFWTYFAAGEIDQLRGGRSVAQCRFEMAIDSGSTLALVYCLKKSNIGKRKDLIIQAAGEILHMETRKGKQDSNSNPKYLEDWIVFRGQTYDPPKEKWVPSYCLADMFYILISNLTTEQLKTVFLKFFLALKYSETLQDFQGFVPLRGLEFLFRWPYQKRFVELMKSIWDVLPGKAYSFFLLQICDKIEPSPNNLFYGEEKYSDYRRLFITLWQESPGHLKRYIFCDREIVSGGKKIILKDGKAILAKQLYLHNFTDDDRQNIKTILASLTSFEKINFLTSEDGIEMCKNLIKFSRFELFYELVSNCFNSEDEADVFRKMFNYTRLKHPCLEFIRKGDFEAADRLFDNNDLPEEEELRLKAKMLFSKRGRLICVQFYFTDIDKCEKFVNWGLYSEARVTEFKRRLLFTEEAMYECQRQIEDGSLNSLDGFVNWCRPDADPSRFKLAFVQKAGLSICESLILGTKLGSGEDATEEVDFTGRRLREVERFLRWCYSSEEDIQHFKRKLLEVNGTKIHTKLIEGSRWLEAETFYAWLSGQFNVDP